MTMAGGRSSTGGERRSPVSMRVGALASIVLACVLGGAASALSAPRQQTADLRIAWSKSPRTAITQPGKLVRYAITVSNNGPDTAGGVTAEVGIILQGATIKSAAIGDQGHCTYEDVLPGVAGFIHCPLGAIADGGAKTISIQVAANRGVAKTGGSIYVVTLSASSDDSMDPDDSNSLFVYLPTDSIQYSISGKLGGGKASAGRIRAKVLIAPEGSRDRSVERYRKLEVFHAPPGADVELRGRRIVELGKTNKSGRLASRKFVNRSLAVGSIFTVKVWKKGMIGDVMRIKVIAGGAALASRQCVPANGGAPRSSCR
jgi:Domain of unknown function DUF11